MHYCGIIKPFDVSMIMVIVYGDWQEIQKFGMQLDKRSIPCRLRNGGQGWVACVNDRSSFHHEIELRRTASWRGCNYSVFLRFAASLESNYFWSVNKNILHKCSIPCTTWIFHADQYSVRLFAQMVRFLGRTVVWIEGHQFMWCVVTRDARRCNYTAEVIRFTIEWILSYRSFTVMHGICVMFCMILSFKLGQ